MSNNPVNNPSVTARQVKILTVNPQFPPTVLFLGQLQGSMWHWKGPRTVPCLFERCDASVHKLRTSFYAYAPVEVFSALNQEWIPAVLQATSNLEQLLAHRSLRGEVWSLLRDPEKGTKGAVSAVFIERFDEQEVSAPFDILPPILRLKDITELTLGVQNPARPKLVMPAVKRRPPAIADLLQVLEPPAPTIEQLQQLADQAERNGQKAFAARSRQEIADRLAAKPSHNGHGKR